MSLSGLIEQTYLPKIALFNSILEKYQRIWASAPTAEEKLIVESEAIDLFYKILSNDTWVDDVSVFEHPDTVDIENTYGNYEQYQKSISARINKLLEMFLLRTNNQQLSFHEITGQIKRIRQKHSVLGLWTGDAAKYFVANRFHNTDGLNSKYTSLDPLDIDTDQAVLTLPLQLKEPVDILDIKIASTSNGVPGSSDSAVTTSNQNLRSLIVESSDWFEYERLDAGPCHLTVTLELHTPSVINSLLVVPVNIGVPIAFEVHDIIFTTSGKDSVSVFSLLPTRPPKDFFSIPIASYTEGWDISFLPVEATSVSITFKQTQAYSIQVESADERVVARDRYAIPLQKIELSRKQYRQNGGVNSVSLPIRKGLNAVEPLIEVNPDNQNLYDLTLEMSFDDGNSWKQVATENNAPVHLIEDNQGAFLWRVSLQRNDQAFDSFTSWFNEEEPVGSIKSLLKTVSRFNSPNTFALTSKAADNNVYTIQPKVMRRGNKDKSLRLGGGVGDATTKLKVPFNVLKTKIRPEEMRLYVGGVEYARKQPGETLAALEWNFSDDHNEVILSADLPAGASVDAALSAEVMFFEEREDGYYHQMKLGFDPDKDNIEIEQLSRDPARMTVLLDRTTKIIYLGKTGLLSGTLDLISAAGDTWTEVSSREDVYDAEDNEYYVDYENGIIYLASLVGDDNVRASFDYQNQLTIPQDDFRIVYSENIPWGVRVNKNALEVRTIEEAIDDPQASIISILTGAYAPRSTFITVGADTKKQLSYDCIVKNSFVAPEDLLDNELLPEEVEYIDGVSEFFGLTEVTDESTVSITAGGDGVVSFSLSARNLWYPDLGVSFSNTTVFNVLEANLAAVVAGSVGDYFIDNEGLVSVQVGPAGTLTAAIKMSYFFKDVLFEPANKYSIDYENGVLYTHDDLNQSAIVRYKTACCKVSYDVANPVHSVYSAETNSVQVRTENLNPINNLVKVIWVENPTPLVSVNLAQYFSPIVGSVGFRFN